MQEYIPIIIGLVGLSVFGIRLIIMLRGIPKLLEAQQKVFDEVRLSLEKRGFKTDRIVKIHLPSSRFYLDPNWVPAVYCFLFIDEKRKKWTVFYNQSREPKIYSFNDFRSINADVNGKPAGDAGLNALIGAFIGGGFGAGIGPSWDAPDGNRYTAYRNTGSLLGAGIGALFAAALTRRYGLIKQMSLKISMNNPNDRFITLPIIDAPLRGLSDKDKGLEYVTSFVSQINEAFEYISDHS
jgi:hypothetical protein